MKKSKTNSIRFLIIHTINIVFILSIFNNIQAEAGATTPSADQIINEQNSDKDGGEEKKTTKSNRVDPIKQWHRITAAIAATRYPFLDQSEESWPLSYQTIVNGTQKIFAIAGPDSAGFIYPSIVILDGEDNIRELIMVENAALVSEERAKIWRFLSTCKNNNKTGAGFSLYVPSEVKEKALSLIEKAGISNYSLHGYHLSEGYLLVDNSLVYYVFHSSDDPQKFEAEIPEDQKVKTEAQINRVIRINVATGYPYLDQGDNSWSPTFTVAVNDEQKRFGVRGPDGMGMIYPSIIVLDKGDLIKCFGLIEPAENVCEERAAVWKFLVETLDNPPSYKFLFIHVPHGLENKCMDILKRNKIQYGGIRGYSIVDGKLMIWLKSTIIPGDDR